MHLITLLREPVMNRHQRCLQAKVQNQRCLQAKVQNRRCLQAKVQNRRCLQAKVQNRRCLQAKVQNRRCLQAKVQNWRCLQAKVQNRNYEMIIGPVLLLYGNESVKWDNPAGTVRWNNGEIKFGTTSRPNYPRAFRRKSGDYVIPFAVRPSVRPSVYLSIGLYLLLGYWS